MFLSDLQRTASLSELARLAEELESGDVARDARDLAVRLAEGRFFLATVGQFKRGKSTLLNALFGESLLPTGVAPVTSTITIIRYGLTASARVTFKDGRSVDADLKALPAFVTENGNPQNSKGVSVVEIFYPAPLLAEGLCLVDTPGLGSVNEANSEETRAFVPHIDAALIVLGVDPPIGADELALAQDVARDVDQLLFVLNKADRLDPDDLEEATQFTAGVLARRLDRPDERIFEISAKERLTAGPTRDWLALEHRLHELSAHKGVVVDQAAGRGMARLTARLLRDVDERRDALIRPVELSERRIADLSLSGQRATQLLQDLAALFRSEEQRMISGFFDTAQRTFAASSTADLDVEVRREVTRLAHTHPGGALRPAAYEATRDIVTRRIRAWLAQIEPEAESLYRRAAGRFVALANDFLTSLRASDDPAFNHLPVALEPEAGFRAPRHFHFTDLMHLTAVTPFAWLLDRALRGRRAVAFVARKTTRYADRLLTSNGSRIIFDLRERVSESSRALESELRYMLEDITSAATKALTQARTVRALGEGAINDELQRLEHTRAALLSLVAQPHADDHESE
jgi:GTP-binding protein EngB required for normal cell division